MAVLSLSVDKHPNKSSLSRLSKMRKASLKGKKPPPNYRIKGRNIKHIKLCRIHVSSLNTNCARKILAKI